MYIATTQFYINDKLWYKTILQNEIVENIINSMDTTLKKNLTDVTTN